MNSIYLQFIIIFNAVIYTPVAYGSYVYPKWAEMIGWGLCMASLICIPLGITITFQQKVGFWVRIIITSLYGEKPYEYQL